MQAQVEIINIEWEGPLTFEEAYEKNGSSDYGVYQYYGDHPVYGLDVLLYIGKLKITGSEKGSVSKISRMEAVKIQIYLGRIIHRKGPEGWPSNEEWGRMIDQAETLLIPRVFACSSTPKRLSLQHGQCRRKISCLS